MITPQQTVESEGEKFALELANLLAEGRESEASAKLFDYSEARKLAYWESVAIADIASRMRYGQRWKKA